MHNAYLNTHSNPVITNHLGEVRYKGISCRQEKY